MDTKQAVRVAGAVRVGFGVAMLFAPRLSARLWLGRETAEQGAVTAAVRGLGARDLAIGLGILLALRRDAPVRGWLEAGALADGADALASLLARGDLPRASRLIVPAAAGAAAGANLVLAFATGRAATG